MYERLLETKVKNNFPSWDNIKHEYWRRSTEICNNPLLTPEEKYKQFCNLQEELQIDRYPLKVVP